MSIVIARCTRCESPLESGDLRCPICAQVAPRETARRDQVEIEVLRCDGCGASVTYDVEAKAPRCAFCGSVMRLETIEDPMEQAEGFLPFTVDVREAETALKRWLGGLGWFRPKDLKSGSTVESLKPLYWVGWMFDAEALVSWAADTNAGSRRAAWAPCSGQTNFWFEKVVVSASRGLTWDETSFVLPGYDPSVAPSEPTDVGGPVIERFDVQRSLARRRILDGIERLSRQRIEKELLPGRRHRKLKLATRLRGLVTQRLAFPAWVLAYRYRDAVYRAVICGQDASMIRAKAPWSWLRIIAVAGGGLLLLLAAVAVAIVLSQT